MKIDQYFQVKFHENRKLKSKRIQRVLNRTFNPSSSSSDSEDGGENNKKHQKGSDKLCGKTAKIKKLVLNKKRSHSKEASMGEEEDETGVNRGKRAKGDNNQVGTCSPMVNRSRGRSRGRGRGRGRARKSSSATCNSEVPAEQTSEKSSCQQTRKQASLENQEDSNGKGSLRTRRTRARPSTSANNRAEARGDDVYANNARTRRKPSNTSASRLEKELMDIAEESSSAPDSTDSEENDDEFYVGPKPVSVFRRGRGRGKGRGRGRGR